MNEIMNYIFGSLRNSEKALAIVQKRLRSQMRFNKNVEIFAFLMTIHAFLITKESMEQKERIRKMEKAIEELKCNKGE